MFNHGKQLVLTCDLVWNVPILHTVNQSVNYTKQLNRRDDKIQTKIENGSLIYREWN